MSRARILGIAVFCIALTLLPGRLAQAQQNHCADLDQSATIYMAGTTAVIPVIRLFGARLKQVKVNLLWNENSEGCSALANFVTDVYQSVDVYSQYDELPDQPGKIYPPTQCTATKGQAVDLVINDVAYQSCPLVYSGAGGLPASLPSGIAEFQGPVQGLVPIVGSSYTYYNDVMAEELQHLYTCGGDGAVMTFTKSSQIFDYNALGSGMRELFARGIGYGNAAPLSTLVGLGGSNNVTAETMARDWVGGTTDPDHTIGYTSTEYYDLYRNLVRGMKVKGLNQNLAYWPDSSMTSTDKINIREGRYTIQGPLRLYARVDPATGVPTKPLVKKIVDWFVGNPVDPSAALPFEILDVFAHGGVVPQCAMKVTKDNATDLPSFKHYQPAEPCGCKYEMLATGKTSIPGCFACTDLLTCCPGQLCSHGFCEPAN
jgi:ABC-type phosphate transport system substrate-binding protein